ncbi:MAG: carbonic anhydrase family protein [Planctomycetota bacterium]
MNGAQYTGEMHLVHQNAEGELAVVGVFLTEGDRIEHALVPIVKGLPDRTDAFDQRGAQVNAQDLLPEARERFSYSGSLTTPPCSEGVRWTVLTTPLKATGQQLGALKSFHDGNARPVQALNGRAVLKGE